MSDWAVVWLATIALALVVTAVVQVMMAIAALRAARLAAETMTELKRDLKPLIEKAHKIADDAAAVTALAATQVERVDRLLGTLAMRVDDAVVFAQQAVIEPFRRGSMLLGALRTGFSLFRSFQQRQRQRPVRDHHHHEEEDALFVG